MRDFPESPSQRAGAFCVSSFLESAQSLTFQAQSHTPTRIAFKEHPRPLGVIGSRACLKSTYREVSGFESQRGHQHEEFDD